ncbi:MAG TPA: GGDEF domain-containing protein, partial [Burkholderiaceae bacterium]|nr:GGDEF domain-containing protein [Burkholderiaceae bacterium]
YMFEALRGAGPAQAHGFDVVLHCNLAHEHLQLGDYLEALRHVDQGIGRCKRLVNPRLHSVLLLNRIICLTELERPHEALVDISRLLELPADGRGRGIMGSGFETMAIAALKAGDLALGSELVERALAAPPAPLPDEQVERIVASAVLDQLRGQAQHALRRLQEAVSMAAGDGVEGLSLRLRCLVFRTQADLHESLGDAGAALAAMRSWQRLHLERAELASRARYQAAALQTELLRLQHKLDDSVARRRATERARSELEASNQQLSRKIEEVESLQAALKRQATRDFLTGLFNRRHLNDVLPGMLALAARDRTPLAVAIIDLDFFKAVNDRHGHDAGDSLLTAFGTLLGRRLRKSDIACRYGGEEFCLLMPRTDAPGAARKVTTLLKLWRNASFDLGGETLTGLSFSAGVSDSRRADASAAQFIKSADDALLAAKAAGRSRVVVAPVQVPQPA